MNPLLFLLVLFCASALGGTSRFLLTDATEKHFKSIFPAGTMIVNVTGAFLIGLLSKVPWESFGSPIAKDVRLLLITGALGGFTTVSAFSVQNLQLIENKCWFSATANILGTCSLCFLAVWGGKSSLNFLLSLF
ncbi:MAG TPA: CrcB family protein [Opitutales bacterium]|nr:CrcB family protein [Opitutales bacterium]